MLPRPLISGRPATYREDSDGKVYLVNPEGVASAMYDIAGRMYTYRTEPQCKVCRADGEVRRGIEFGLVSGRTYAELSRWASQKNFESMSASSIQRHRERGHMPEELLSSRGIVEAVHRGRGNDPDAMDELLLDQVAFARVVMQHAFDDVALGRQNPTVKEGLAAASLLDKIESEAAKAMSSDEDVDTLRDILFVYYSAVVEAVDSETLDRIHRGIERHPIFQSIMARNAEAVDAESSETSLAIGAQSAVDDGHST